MTIANNVQELPNYIDSEAQLEELLSRPDAQLVEFVKKIASPLVIIGAGGKMGPSLALLAKRAAQEAGHPLQIIAASRFRQHQTREWLESQSIETRTIDVFDRMQMQQLPDSPNVIYLVGMKFGTSVDPVPTWVTNTIGPMLTAERYPGSKLVALSTGNVYPLVDIASGGCAESHELTPLGEYANAAVARERIFQHFSTDSKHLSPTVSLRLNYAHDLRYGVLSDIARKVYEGEPIDLSIGYFNAIWQGDANSIVLRSFQLCSNPASALNLTSTEIYSVRSTAEHFGTLLHRKPVLVGHEQPTALLSDASKMKQIFGEPTVKHERLMDWVAHWVRSGGRSLNKPTHFESRDGKY